jgi:hypothetical protein
MPALPTSPLRKADLQTLLSQMAESFSAKAVSSSTAFRAAKQWASYASLINGQELTAEGRLVATKDPYLEATVTDWLIHFNLSLSNHSLWNYFVYNFLQKHPSFTQDELLTCCLEVFKTEPEEKLKKSLKLILRAYTEQQAIAKNKFLTQQKKSYSAGNPDLSNPYATGYFLARIWERDFKARVSVLVNEISDAEMGLNTVLGISKESLLQQLDTLAEHKVIEQRSAKPHLAGTKPRTKDENEFPYQVHRCWDTSVELLEKAYENDIATPNRPLIQSLGAILDDDDNVPDFSQFLEWASRLVALDGGSNTIVKLVS